VLTTAALGLIAKPNDPMPALTPTTVHTKASVDEEA
jgi:hypothetical protein